MATVAHTLRVPDPLDPLRLAREVIEQEGHALLALSKRLDEGVGRAIKLLVDCPGSVIVLGIGKAGLIGNKIAATLASTGTRSHFLHPVEAVHGDLGRIAAGDVALILSQSGETAEVIRLLPVMAELGLAVVAITARRTSTLGRAAAAVVELGVLDEACPHGLAPSTSTTAMLAVGDALALATSRLRGFGRADFARLHPGGSLGRKLAHVEEEMRPLSACRVASQDDTAREVFVRRRLTGRRSGAVMLVDRDGKLSGIFTDSDLARLFECRRDAELDGPIAALMTRAPKSVLAGTLLLDAVHLMAEKKISELPVVDSDGRPVGMLDITDVVGLLPEESANFAPAEGTDAPASEFSPPTVPFTNSGDTWSRT
ncbi:MAG: KpsF/GutQ family sugar-phosphate isomerase [Pirellulales bacterium]